MDILRTHPMVIVGGILQENPFFVAPDEFPDVALGHPWAAATSR